MGTIWIKELTGGLDARRLPETTPGGVLIKGQDGHITRGGEFEKRAAFVPAYTLPSGTVGLASDQRGLVVFGGGEQPTEPPIPAGVRYQRLPHPDDLALVSVPSYDLYDGKIYAVGQYEDGSVYHFYDGVIVDDWFDGRARASFTVTGGTGADEMTDLTVGGVSLFTDPVSWATSNEATATAIAAEINDTTSSPNYTATAVGARVNIIAADTGSAANSLPVAATLTGAFAVTPLSGLVMAGGGDEGGTQATGSFRISGGAPGATIQVSVDGVALTAAPVACGASDAATATAVAAAVNAHTSSPNYTAASDGTRVVLTAVAEGDAANGLTPTFVVTGLPPTGGARASASFAITGLNSDIGSSLLVGALGVPQLPIYLSATSGETINSFASRVAASMTSYVVSPDCTATAAGNVVTVTAATIGSAPNGQSLSFSAYGVVIVSSVTPFAGGADPTVAGSITTEVVAFSGGSAADAFTPGAFVKTVGSKMYSTSGSLLHFSGIAAPTMWSTDAIGAGFINMASENSGSEQLTAVARYQSLLAVFSPEVVQIWGIDPDPNLNTQRQVLANTGTFAPRSVTQFGDADVFYLDESGLRSLRARDSSNAASTTDIGVPIDVLLTAKVATLTDAEKRRIIGLINPIDKRFWLVVKDEIYVFTFFQNAKVSAWTTYTTKARTGDVELTFEAEHAAVFNKRPYLRAGNVVFVYGGREADLVYDDVQPEAWLPYLDANRPTAAKQWEGLDVACSGDWEVRAAMDPTNTDMSELLARVNRTTYNLQRVPFGHTCSHVSLRFRGTGSGPAILSAAVLHFAGDEDED